MCMAVISFMESRRKRGIIDKRCVETTMNSEHIKKDIEKKYGILKT